MTNKKSVSHRQAGDSDFTWLKKQALDQNTLDYIERIESDERAFQKEGIVTRGEEQMELHFRQGIFHTVRATGHSIAHIFVHIFKNREHMLAPGFGTMDKPIIVDIGANEGYYAMCMAKDSNAQIFAIEPNPIAYDLLCKNVTSNRANNITTLNYAVWSTKGMVNLSVVPQVTSIGTVVPIESSFMSIAQERVVQIPVKSITLSDLIETYNLTHIDLLKIDIEGGELEVLKSSLSVLSLVDRIVIEYHSQELKDKIAKLLAHQGYVLQVHFPDREQFGDLYFTKRELVTDTKTVKNMASLLPHHSLSDTALY